MNRFQLRRRFVVASSVTATLLLGTTANAERPREHQRRQAWARPMVDSTRIIGGEDAPEGAYPWMASVMFADESDPEWALLCGGTLIAPQWVLTAGHCVLDYDVDTLASPELLDVAVAPHELAAITDRIAVDAILAHPNFFDKTLDSDLALLHLSEAATDAPIAGSVLPDEADTLTAAGVMSRVIGFGVTSTDTFELPEILQQVDVPILGETACEAGLGDLVDWGVGYTDNMLCAGYDEGGKDSCYGDSGGPLMVTNDDGEYVLAGVVSFGAGCAEPGAPGYYTRVSQFSGATGWIEACTEEPDTCDRLVVPPYVCDTGEEFSGWWECDFIVDCPGGEDEADCDYPQFTCDDGSTIPAIWECDFFVDCPDGSDEGPDCDYEAFYCDDGTPIPPEWECDFFPDCPDLSDEDHCVPTQLVEVHEEPAGENCEFGGTKLLVGIDEDIDGELSEDEITDVSYICNGADGLPGKSSQSRITPEPPGPNCEAGGNKIEFGLDLDDNGVLDDGEVQHSTYVCDGRDGMLTCSATGSRNGWSTGMLLLLLAGVGCRRRRPA